MKKILFIIFILIAAIVGMAYLYFSGLNAKLKNNDSSLYAATYNSAFIFSFENDKSILEILKSQNLFREIAGEDKFSELESLNKNLLAIPELITAIDKEVIYLSLIADSAQQMDLLYSTQLNLETNKSKLLAALKKNSLSLNTTGNLSSIVLLDSSEFYIGIKDNLIFLSSQQKIVQELLIAPFPKPNAFVEFIKSNSRIAKNNLAEVYVNYKLLPGLLKSVTPEKMTGELGLFNEQPSYASFSYNFSKEKVLLTGVTFTEDEKTYYNLFNNMSEQKITITNILPENTANYTVFAIDNYASWHPTLMEWFKTEKQEKVNTDRMKNYNEKYRLDLNNSLPKYFKNQFITFQLSTTEKIGAISLTNGDKVNQLLIDLSTDYNADIKTMKEDYLLYMFFGEPMKKFRRPAYCIVDNYLVFSNNPSTLQSFLNDYRNNHLLIDNEEYAKALNQLSNTANIRFYIGLKNSSVLFSKNIYQHYYRHINDQRGLKNYTAFIYQMGGDNGKFQTNVLLDRKTQSDSLSTIP